MSRYNRVKIPNVLFFQEGPGVRNTQYTTSGVKLLNVANLQNGKVDLSTSERYISEKEAYGKYSHFLVDDGDFIIASSGIKVDYFERKMGFINSSHLPLCMNTSTIRFKTLDENILEIRYFMFFLKSNDFKEQLGHLITGSAQLNFGPSHLKQMEIPLPPPEEQRRIAESLDLASSLIEKRKRQIELLDLLAKSLFVEMFGDPVENPMGWDVATIDTVCKKIVGGGTPSKSNTEYYTGNIPWVTPKDMKSVIIKDSIDHITQEAVKKSSTTTIPPLSILMVIRSGILKHTLPIAMNICEVTLNQDMKAFITNENVKQWYLFHFFKGIESQLLTQVRGVTADNIEFDLIKYHEIPIPPISLQKQFADRITAIETQKSQLQSGLEKLEMNYKALMQKYFEEV